MTKWFRNNTDKEITDEREILGTIQESIMSSQIVFAKEGACLGAVLKMRNLIDGVSASLWSVVALTVQIKNGKTDMQPMLDNMDVQINHQLNLIHKICTGIAEGESYGETLQ
jgi:hypothetical protein